MSRKFLIALIVTLLFPHTIPVYALDTSFETGKSSKEDKENSLSIKGNYEKKGSKGKKTGETTSKGIDKQDQEAIKSIGQAMSQSGADVTLPLEAVFMSKIAELERNTEPFLSCRIATNPKLGRDFGLSAEIQPGVIEPYKADYLTKAAQSNNYIRDIADEQAIRAYRNCLASYGAVIAQSYLYLAQDLDDLKASVGRDKEGAITVNGIGYDDFIILADAALKRALRGLTNATVKGTYERVINDNAPCQFDRSLENIKCGSSLVTLGSIPQLTASGVKIYGGSFMGFQGSYKLSKSWSYQDAIEKLKTTSKYAKFAQEVAKYTEALESKGLAADATFVRKKAWEIAKSGKQTLSPAKLMPGTH
ncbi:MAG: hypothetical protein AB1553_05690 [Nitrospirota bacterium]